MNAREKEGKIGDMRTVIGRWSDDTAEVRNTQIENEVITLDLAVEKEANVTLVENEMN